MEKIYIEIPDMPCIILLIDGVPTGECETTDDTEIAVLEWLMENIGDELEGKGYVHVIDGTGHL